MSTTKKTVNLTISERLSSVAILNAFKGDLDKLAVILDDIKLFSITDEEWTKADKVFKDKAGKEFKTEEEWKKQQESLPEKERGGSMNWSDEKGGTKEITIGTETVEYIKKSIKEKSDKGELTLEHKTFITLMAKLSA